MSLSNHIRSLGKVIYRVLDLPRKMWPWPEAYLGLVEFGLRALTFAAPLIGYQAIQLSWRELPGLWPWLAGPMLIIGGEIALRLKIARPRLSGVHSSAGHYRWNPSRNKRMRLFVRLITIVVALCTMLALGLAQYIQVGRSKSTLKIAVASIDGLAPYEAEVWSATARRVGEALPNIRIAILDQPIQGNATFAQINDSLAYNDLVIRGYSWEIKPDGIRKLEIRSHGGSLGNRDEQGNLGFFRSAQTVTLNGKDLTGRATIIGEALRCRIELEIGEEFLLRQNYDAALSVLNYSLHHSCPLDVFPRRQQLQLLARAYLAKGRPDLALAFAKELEFSSTAEDCETIQLLYLSEILKDLGGLQDMSDMLRLSSISQKELQLKTCRDRLKSMPDSRSKAIALSEFSLLETSSNEALAMAKQALELIPDHPQLRFNLALTEARRGNFTACVSNLDKSIQLGRWDSESFAMLALCQVLDNRPFSATANSLVARLIAPGSFSLIAAVESELLWSLAKAPLATWIGTIGNQLRGMSISRLEEYLSANPGHVFARLKLVDRLNVVASYAKAEGEANRILAVFPCYDIALVLRSVAQLRDGRANLAASGLRIALEEYRSHPYRRVYSRLGGYGYIGPCPCQLTEDDIKRLLHEADPAFY